MDDQRDYEEEHAQQAALEEEQAAELTDSAPVDSSSPDYEGPEVNVESGKRTRMAFEGVLDQPLIGQLIEVLELVEAASSHFLHARDLADRGFDASSRTIQLEVGPFEAMALSLGLNLVGFFQPAMAADAESLLRRASDTMDTLELTEEQREQLKQIHRDIQDEGIAAMLGISVEEFRAEKERAKEQLAAQQAEEIDAEIEVRGDGSHLN